jgi:hypothetical protein
VWRAVLALCLGLILVAPTTHAARLALPPVPHYEVPEPALPQPAAPPRYTEHYYQGDVPRNIGDNKSDNRKSLWERITDDAVAFTTLCLVGVTGVLALSTVGLWIVTGSTGRRQSRDMQKSISIAERSLTDLERPFLYVTAPTTGVTFPTLNQMTFGEGMESHFTNHGRTPANLINLIQRVIIVPVESGTPRLPPPIDPQVDILEIFPEGTVIAQGGTREFTADIMSGGGGDAGPLFAEFLSGSARVFFYGYMRYEDIFGNRYLNGFCMILERERNIFIRIGGMEYNYMSKEDPKDAPAIIREQRPTVDPYRSRG